MAYNIHVVHTHTIHTQSQLRNKLAMELQRTSRPPPLHSPKKACNSMTVQVANGMVAEYLKKAGCSYTLSVFLPEAGVNMDKVHCQADLLIREGLV